MKRGYMDWNKDILPEMTLKTRRDILAETAKENNLEAVLVYGDVYDADELSWFCNYSPYWCNSVLIVTKNDAPVLVTGHNHRVNPWIGTLTGFCDEEIIPAGMKVPAKVAEVLSTKFPEGGKIGLIGKYAPESLESELSKKNFIVTELDRSFKNTMPGNEESFRNMEKKAYSILIEAVKEGTEKCEINASGRKICAEIEYAARRNGAMDIFTFVSNNGSAFQLPSPDEAMKAKNIYILMQYLGVWVGYGFPADHAFTDDNCGLNAIAKMIKPGYAGVFNDSKNQIIVRCRGAADMVSSLANNEEAIEEGAIISVAMIEKDTGLYYERMYEVLSDGASAFL